ncbi:MAG: phosphate/phosphite/phosphonate ABC transporter substrate-binding protein [Chloroflexi bacterium]|nr:phosphate/phosphite/phosphonate ABC transporter substrate-binding protein [Chloroflexota bacterium]
MDKPVIVGAVLYDPKVAVIWEMIAGFFAERQLPMDTVFYTNYELLVSALLQGHIDIAWNSPLGWVDAQRRSGGLCRAIAMRDTDRDRVSHWVVRTREGIGQITDLRGKAVAVGAKDSPQATLIPLSLLRRHGLEPGKDVQVREFNVLVGKHGDHVGGEQQAFQCLARGEAEACAILDLNWEAWTGNGTINPLEYNILATTDPFDHCVFTVAADFPPDLERQWLKTLLSMDYTNPNHKEVMDMEGLRQWLPGRTSGFTPLSKAVDESKFFEGV